MTHTYKIYTPAGEYVASTRFATDAVRIAAAHGPGSRIRHKHRKWVWHEGREAVLAATDPITAASVIIDRVHEYIHGESK